MGKEPLVEAIQHLTLGSRRNLCINPAVSKLHSVTAINERCMELQQPSTAQEHKCVFLPDKDNQAIVNNFRDHALATIRDIEDMGSLGKDLGICPYYALRSAIKPAEIVTLPYPLLLQKSARDALGISLKGHVIIIDEAHNLMDAIAGIEGVEVSLKQLRRARAQLGVYLQKFRNKLKGKNRVYVAQVVRVIDSLMVYLEGRLAIPVHPVAPEFGRMQGLTLYARKLTELSTRKNFCLEKELIKLTSLSSSSTCNKVKLLAKSKTTPFTTRSCQQASQL